MSRPSFKLMFAAALLSLAAHAQQTEPMHVPVAIAAEATAPKVAAKADERVKPADLEAKRLAVVESKLRSVRKSMAEGDAAYGDALRKVKSAVQSVRCSEDALASYQAAERALAALLKTSKNDEAIAKLATGFTQQIREKSVAACLHAARIRIQLTNLKGATEWANRALELDPQSAEAKATIRAIEAARAATSNSHDWRWRLVGR